MPKTSGRETEALPALERWASLFSSALLLLVAFVIFLRHHDYGLWRSDSLQAIGALLALGVVPGVASALGPRSLRAGVFAIVATLFLDLQTPWLREPVGLGLAVALLLALGWFANAVLGRATAFVALVMIASTLPLSPGEGWIREEAAGPGTSAGATEGEDRPPILHLVLDEHIATAAIPREFDRDGRLRHHIEGGYLARGFRVFPQAFSRHYTTGPALSHVVNLSAGRDSVAYYDPETDRVTRNAWFRMLAGRGYRIRVVQTDHLDFCHPDEDLSVELCTTYTLESIKAIEGSGLDRADRSRALLGSFGQLSHWHQRTRKAWQRWARERGLERTDWPLRAGRLSTVSSRQMLPRVEAALAATQPGEITFAHLLLPHFPYAYDAGCALRPSPLEWRSYKGVGLSGVHNDDASRAERYPLYLEQLACTEKLVSQMLGRLLALPHLRDATVIVHGDHGPRLNRLTPVAPNRAKLDARDYLDAFATHFAVRVPGLARGVDLRAAGIDALLRVIATLGTIPEDDGWIGSPKVHLVGARRDDVVSHTMPSAVE